MIKTVVWQLVVVQLLGERWKLKKLLLMFFFADGNSVEVGI
jgi:hypothetical protein